jgi:thiol-disulfide isomerase/thioredoxin
MEHEHAATRGWIQMEIVSSRSLSSVFFSRSLPPQVCGTCSYNNDQSNVVCEICNAAKPKVQRNQKKIVSLWSCPICTRLVTSDKQACDVCTSDKEAIRSVAPAAESTSKDFASLFGNSLIGKDGVPANVADLAGKTVAVYFSAKWCAPCRAFTPQLASIYSGAVAANLPFEIVFVSADSDVEEFNEYFRTMPWQAVKYSDTETRKRLNALFEVQGIPTLVVLDSQGNLITSAGRNDLASRGDAAVAEWCNKSAAATGVATK